MTFIYYFALVVFVLLAILLCVVILVQESKSMGLGASFGGDTSDSLFGTATADVLKKVTTWLAITFFAGCIIISMWTASFGREQTKRFDPASVIEEVNPGS